MKRKSALVFGVLLTLGVAFATIITYYDYDSKVDAVIERAQVSADREDIRSQLYTLKTNLEKLGWTEGHFALLWKTPENDLKLHYQAVNRLIERLDGIKEMPKSSVAYQTALDDIRGTIREIPNPGAGMLWVKFWWLWIGLVTYWLAFWSYLMYRI